MTLQTTTRQGRPDEDPAVLARHDAARSLLFLQHIEFAVDSSSKSAQAFRLIVRDFRLIDETLRDVSGPVDRDGDFRRFLSTAAGAAERLHGLAMSAFVLAKEDPQLRPEDGVVDGLGDQVDALSDLYGAIETVRVRVETLDALAEAEGSPAGKAYTAATIGELVADIRKSS